MDRKKWCDLPLPAFTCLYLPLPAFTRVPGKLGRAFKWDILFPICFPRAKPGFGLGLRIPCCLVKEPIMQQGDLIPRQ
jgi:hypothetical protein